ncbi:MAG: competence/damage-inducible protein A [Candidatus Geothermarchaeales archaeon]
MRVQAEIIAIGNELLMGETLDTNSNWIARRLREMGISVRRITIVGDDRDEIVNAFSNALNRGSNLIFTTGGLGPTGDDLTFEALAMATHKKLVLNREAFEMVKRKYEDLASKGFVKTAKLTSPRLKMATLPEGADPLPNPVGVAPGIKMTVKGALVIALPGVPSEMKGVFEEHVPDLIMDKWGRRTQVHDVDVSVEIGDESKLAPILAQVQGEIPGVQLKSMPSVYGAEVTLKVRVRAEGRTLEECRERVDKAVGRLRELVGDRD